MKLLNPAAIAVLALLMAALLAITGIYLLAGLAWCLIAGAVPLLLLAATLFRGIHRAQQISR